MIEIIAVIIVSCLVAIGIFLASRSGLAPADAKLRQRVLALDSQVKGLPMEKAIPMAQKAFPELSVKPIALDDDGGSQSYGNTGPITSVTLAYFARDPAKKVVVAELE